MNDRFTPASGHFGNIAVNDRLRPNADIAMLYNLRLTVGPFLPGAAAISSPARPSR